MDEPGGNVPFSFLVKATKAVPAVRFAIGVGGIISVIAIVVAWLKISVFVAVFGAVIMFILMTILVIFSRLASAPNSQFHLPMVVFTWFSLIIVMATALGLFLSVFGNWPLPLRPRPRPQNERQPNPIGDAVNSCPDPTGKWNEIDKRSDRLRGFTWTFKYDAEKSELTATRSDGASAIFFQHEANSWKGLYQPPRGKSRDSVMRWDSSCKHLIFDNLPFDFVKKEEVPISSSGLDGRLGPTPSVRKQPPITETKPADRSNGPRPAGMEERPGTATQPPSDPKPVPPPQPKAENQTQTPPGAPPSLIPNDPIKAVETVNRMRNSIAEVLSRKQTITFLITWPKDDNTYLVFVSRLLSSACRDTPRQCWFTQEGNPQDLDKPPVKVSGRPGITVHGIDAYALASALGAWFVTHSTSTFPTELNGYNEYHTQEIMWIEIGPGSPWKLATN